MTLLAHSWAVLCAHTTPPACLSSRAPSHTCPPRQHHDPGWPHLWAGPRRVRPAERERDRCLVRARPGGRAGPQHGRPGPRVAAVRGVCTRAHAACDARVCSVGRFMRWSSVQRAVSGHRRKRGGGGQSGGPPSCAPCLTDGQRRGSASAAFARLLNVLGVLLAPSTACRMCAGTPLKAHAQKGGEGEEVR